MVKGGPRGRGRMGQVLTPEEMAALLEGLREAGGGQDPELQPSPSRVIARSQGCPEHRQNSRFQNLSNWLRARTEIQWPSL
jgi:hypothetical protein